MTNQIASFIGSSTTFRRLAVAGLLASALLGSAVAPVNASPCYFGECGPAPVAAAATPEYKIIANHGTWSAKTNGTTTFVINRFDDGSKFAVVDKNGGIYLVFDYDGWHWQDGKKFPIKIDVDGEIFNGTVEANSGTTLISSDVKGAFVKALFNGRKAKIEVAGDTFTITSLGDGRATLDEAVTYQRSASR